MGRSASMKDYIFKIVILGTSDQLKEEFLSLISERSWHVDGVSGHRHSTDGVSIDIWFPKDDASSKILVSFSYHDVNGALIVMGRKDRRNLRRFVKIIRDEIGNVPYVGIVIRKSMTEPEKGVKSLHAIKILSDKMKAYASGIGVGIFPESQSTPPKVIAGKPPPYNVDEFGFVHPNDSGIPLFANEEEEEEKEPKIGRTTYLNEDKEKKLKKSQVSYT